MAGWREEVRKAGFRVSSSTVFFVRLEKSGGGSVGGGESKGQDVLWRKVKRNKVGNEMLGKEVNGNVLLCPSPSHRSRVGERREGVGDGRRSAVLTGAAAVDGIDHTIWREESRCGFQSRRHEREIIPAACSRRTYFYSPVRLWGEGRGGAELPP